MSHVIDLADARNARTVEQLRADVEQPPTTSDYLAGVRAAADALAHHIERVCDEDTAVILLATLGDVDEAVDRLARGLRRVGCLS